MVLFYLVVLAFRSIFVRIEILLIRLRRRLGPILGAAVFATLILLAGQIVFFRHSAPPRIFAEDQRQARSQGSARSKLCQAGVAQEIDDIARLHLSDVFRKFNKAVRFHQ